MRQDRVWVMSETLQKWWERTPSQRVAVHRGGMMMKNELVQNDTVGKGVQSVEEDDE